MVFSSVEFLFYFLPVVVGVYHLAPTRLRNLVLLLASTMFYIWGGGALVAILAFSVVVDYCLGWVVWTARRDGRHRLRRLAVGASVLANLSMLGYFKYANFFVDQLNAVGERLGLGTIAWTSVVLPIGISFYTFQSMSYTINVARGRCEHLRNPLDFALFVVLFPQLIAGPIVRYHELREELVSRRTSLDGFATGVVRFSHGLAKKVVVADAVAVIADGAFSSEELGWRAAWLGIVAYTLQIYFDFSGYSDMAIGLGMMFGFTFPENFDRPYSAYSITDFWRRWHITLSNWFRDYVYVPLGGNRSSVPTMYRNLVIVFVVTGVWHGANWTFLAWGGYHGLLMLVERRAGRRGLEGVARPVVARAATLLLVMVGWVMFRAESIGAAGEFYASMAGLRGHGPLDAVDLGLEGRNVTVLVLASLVFVMPRGLVVGRELARSTSRFATPARLATVGLALPYAAVLVASGTFSPFLYYQF